MSKSRVDESYWIKHKVAWESSGLSQRSYSNQEGLCNRKFNYHVKRLTAQSSKRDFKFIEAPSILVKSPVREEVGRLRLELPNGVAIVLELSADLPLTKVLEVAGAFRC